MSINQKIAFNKTLTETQKAIAELPTDADIATAFLERLRAYAAYKRYAMEDGFYIAVEN